MILHTLIKKNFTFFAKLNVTKELLSCKRSTFSLMLENLAATSEACEDGGKRRKLEERETENPTPHRSDQSMVSKETTRMEYDHFRYMRDVSSSCEVNFSSSDIRKQIIHEKVKQRRSWWCTDFGQNFRKNHRRGIDFTIMTYNVLSQELLECHKYLYGHSDEDYLQWNYRSKNLMHEIGEANSDIICLQEVQENHYFEFFQPHLKEMGYLSLFKKKTGDKCDGCAIFFKNDIFSLDCHAPIEYRSSNLKILDKDQIGLIVVLQPKAQFVDTKLCIATTHLIFNPKRGDIKLSQLRFFLAEIDKYAFKNRIDDVPVYHPVVLCGDMNTEPFSPLYNFLTCGSIYYEDMRSGNVSGQRMGFNKGRHLTSNDLVLDSLGINYETRYEHVERYRDQYFGTQNKRHLELASSLSNLRGPEFTKENLIKPSCSESSVSNSNVDIIQCDLNTVCSEPNLTKKYDYKESKKVKSSFYHHLNFISAYNHINSDGSLEVTTHNSRTMCTVDYIFYNVMNKDSFQVDGRPKHKNVREGMLKHLGSYGLPNKRFVKDIGGLPNAHLSSDHVSLISRFWLQFE